MAAAVNSTTKTDSLRRIPAIGLPVAMLVSCGVLAVQPELRLAVPLLVGMTALMATVLAFSLHIGEHGLLKWSPQMILAVALLLRLMFLFSPPQLSDDIYRYLWDGSNLLQGVNPYAAASSSVRPSPELAVIHSRINHPLHAPAPPRSSGRPVKSTWRPW